ncbi:hypothetical protein BT96DRAFT_81906 [Gymnopus androsaceus JB14]|uniref:Uncharacterized protein n=1 Tax=Gymnopus androsaceus JB14 TaxID=1447944 RepID=A0A6A4IAK7_9AGAR|nr:hypothetical protein BT96DRAFT_81906 [Gymnopus androsaceus JB14]
MVAFASAVGNVANGTISSPIAPRSHQLHFPIANTPLGPMTNPNATNAFPTLNSPLGAGFEFNHGLPLPHAPPSTSASASALVPPSTSTSISNPFPFPSSSTWSKPRLSHQTLLRAHRAISTAFRLLRDTDNANVDTETNGSGAGAGAPTPGAVGAPTPGASTVGAMTPGSGSAPTPTGNSSEYPFLKTKCLNYFHFYALLDRIYSNILFS